MVEAIGVSHWRANNKDLDYPAKLSVSRRSDQAPTKATTAQGSTAVHCRATVELKGAQSRSKDTGPGEAKTTDFPIESTVTVTERVLFDLID